MKLQLVVPALPILLGTAAVLTAADRSQGSHETAGEAAGSAEAVAVILEDGGTGPHPAMVTEDAGLPGMTIYWPRDLSGFGGTHQLPVLLWGNRPSRSRAIPASRPRSCTTVACCRLPPP